MIASPERQALSAFLTRLGDPPLEAEVEDYLSRALRDADDSESQELSELVAGFSPGFAGLPASQQHVLMADLLKGVRAAEEEQPRPTATARSQQHVAGTTDISGNLASDLLPRLSSLAGGSSDNATSVAAGRPHQGDVVAGPVAAPVGMQQHVVETLHELCPLPHVDADFLLHVFLKKGCSLEVAAAWMLECSNLEAVHDAWCQAARRRKQEQELKALEAKKAVVSRYHLVPDDSGKSGRAKLSPWGAGAAQENKCRFRDGTVATKRGEKYVIETQREEWDGGSRGKVFTKGKRGKGFV